MNLDDEEMMQDFINKVNDLLSKIDHDTIDVHFKEKIYNEFTK